jgi:cyanophycinase-like exopeptidase
LTLVFISVILGKNIRLKLLFLLFPIFLFAQGYTSFFTGNATNITTIPTFGVCLMGGATESDEAMAWFVEKANGGDVLVLRSSGSDGYNNYLYSQLGVSVNSVETLVITSVAGAINPYVLGKIANAELIWFAGGDQFNYVSFFKDNAAETALNSHINIKNAPIGGTSAGMAILGNYYFSAQNGSLTSAQALANPFASNMTIGGNDFLEVPFLENTITDTHYDNPNRKGRQTAFLARLTQTLNARSFGIASNEYVAVCVGIDGKAYVYGDFLTYEEFAYFLQTNCNHVFPEIMNANSPLTWNNNGQAVKVYKVAGTTAGTNYFDLSDWQSGSGGTWENWSVVNGTFTAVGGLPVECSLNTENFTTQKTAIYPIPFQENLTIKTSENTYITVYDCQGRELSKFFSEAEIILNTSNWSSGVYIVKLENKTITFQKIIKN